jgi:hypothetical protein
MIVVDSAHICAPATTIMEFAADMAKSSLDSLLCRTALATCQPAVTESNELLSDGHLEAELVGANTFEERAPILRCEYQR